jgi:alpha-beta hydrolase superfamily lysophospholipase
MKSIIILGLTLALCACGDASFQRERRSKDLPQPEVTEAEPSAPLPEGPADSADQVAEEAPEKAADESVQEPLYDPGRKGPYAVSSSTETLADPAYNSAIIYYPSDPEARIIGASTLSGGFTNTKEQMSWLAEHLASHGVITLVFTPTNNQSLNPNIWATGHKGGFQKLKSEAQRAGSPIQGKVDEKKIGIMGFSMGGAGTILAVNELGSSVKAAVPICAFRPVTPTAAIPLLLLTGTNDTVAIPANIIAAYAAMPETSPKALANFNGMTHLDVVNGGAAAQHENLAYYATAWYRVYMAEDGRYKTYLSGDEQKKKVEAGIFANPDDFRLVP